MGQDALAQIHDDYICETRPIEETLRPKGAVAQGFACFRLPRRCMKEKRVQSHWIRVGKYSEMLFVNEPLQRWNGRRVLIYEQYY